MLVKPKTPVKYKGKRYEIGQEFDIDKKVYEGNKKIFDVVVEKAEKAK